jgi:hypothetical protein
LVAVALVIVIVVAIILLVTQGLPALREEDAPFAATAGEPTPTPVPTFTAGPTLEPTDTPPPAPTEAWPSFVMTDTYSVYFSFESAGARPGSEWTGFFGQVFDAQSNPLPGVPLIVLYADGTPAELVGVPTSPIVKTDATGSYEMRLADGPFAGTWNILVLTDEGYPASEIYTFMTDENTETGIQQIQIIWKQVP